MALVLLAGLLVVPASLAPTASAATGATTRVSVATGGTQANGNSGSGTLSADGNLFGGPPVISADGRYVAFESVASNLVAGDTNGREDVFVRDVVTGATTRVSLANGGAQANNDSQGASISADGRFVAFGSVASNLVAGDTNGKFDVFVHDRDTGATTRISVATDGTQANNYSFSAAISADGRYVAFTSDASNLVAGDTNDTSNVFVHDRDTGATTRISVASDGTQANNAGVGPSISADGRYVAFFSMASNLVAGDTNDTFDVFVHDRDTGTTTRVSVASGGIQANNYSIQPAISADGRYVAFQSWPSDPVSGETTGRRDVFVRDRVTGATTRVSIASSGTQANNDSSSGGAAISADGRFVTFESLANNLVAGDTNGKQDVFVRDRLAPGLAAVTRLSDFNKDGATDLIARDAAGRLWLYPGNGSGEFKSRRQIGVGWNSMTAIITPGDVTGDRNADVLGRDTAGRLWLYPGNGAGRFLSRRQIGSGWKTMTAVTNAANLNGAGRPDLLARDTTGGLWLYPLTGNAVFGSRSKIGTGWNGYTILGPGDVSGDGRADIHARDPAGSLWLYRGNGTGRVGGRTLVSAGWAAMTALVTPGNWDRAAGNDLLARDAAGGLWLHPGNNTGGLGTPRQIGSGWGGFTYIG